MVCANRNTFGDGARVDLVQAPKRRCECEWRRHTVWPEETDGLLGDREQELGLCLPCVHTPWKGYYVKYAFPSLCYIDTIKTMQISVV